MAGPVWDGDEEDPWLPSRLAARLDIARAERLVRDTWLGEFTAWITRTSRRVLRGVRPEPEEIFPEVPAWEQAVGRVLRDAVKPVMGWAYERMFGAGFDWENRPAVVSYLATVRNRMVRTPQEVFDLVAGQISAGVIQGEGIPEIADRVDEVLSVTRTERWPNRAVVVARTEAMGALNRSRSDAFDEFVMEDEADEPYERMWLATSDSRTRPEHRLADGQRRPMGLPFIVGGFPMMFPGDPSAPPHLTVQCRCTTLLVRPGEVIDLSDRQMRP